MNIGKQTGKRWIFWTEGYFTLNQQVWTTHLSTEINNIWKAFVHQLAQRGDFTIRQVKKKKKRQSKAVFSYLSQHVSKTYTYKTCCTRKWMQEKCQNTSAILLARTRSLLSMYPNGNHPAFPLHSPSAQPLFVTCQGLQILNNCFLQDTLNTSEFRNSFIIINLQSSIQASYEPFEPPHSHRVTKWAPHQIQPDMDAQPATC